MFTAPLKLKTAQGWFFAMACCAIGWPGFAQLGRAQDAPKPDDRYKADILVVLAHPDDDTEIAGYLAKVVFDDHKRVAVIYGTRGDAGNNHQGMEQGWTLGDVREIEGRRALAALGITNIWFLRGPDTPGQDVLHSLETWHHGASLESIVRFVRLTRPEVVLTMLPDYVVGENHEDHQAAAVLATEAFDLAADPLAFPEQIAVPRNHDAINNYAEGLKRWQPKKIYYFDVDGHHVFEGRGPQYSATEVSPAKGLAYGRFKEQAWGYYVTQNDYTSEQLQTAAVAPMHFILGKSLVKSTVTGDIFEGVAAEEIPFSRPRGYVDKKRSGVRIELGGPWAFYQDFWSAHDLSGLESLVTPEAGVAPGAGLWVPLLIHNDTPVAQQITLRSVLPEGWVEHSRSEIYTIEPHDTYPVQITLTAPKEMKPAWQELTWSVEADGKRSGQAQLRIYPNVSGLPQ